MQPSPSSRLASALALGALGALVCALWLWPTRGADERALARVPILPISPHDEEAGELVELERAPARAPTGELRAQQERATELDSPADVPAELRSCWFRLSDADTARPIVGALACTQARPLGPWQKEELELERRSQTSTSEGLLEVRSSEAQVATVRIDAQGYGSVVVRVEPGFERRQEARPLELVRSAALVLRAVDEFDRPLARLRFELLAQRSSLAQPDSSDWLLAKGEWRAYSDESGVAVFEALPARAALALCSRGRLGEMPRYPGHLWLEPGERRELTWRIPSPATLEGRLLDQHGRPVADREIWLTREALNVSPGRERLYLRAFSSDPARLFARAKSDGSGAWRFEGVRAGSWWIGPGALQDADASEVAPVAQRLEVQGSASGILLRASRGLFVAGHVQLPDGTPVERGQIEADSALGVTGCSIAAGRFRLGPLEPGPHSLRAQGWFLHAPGEMGHTPSERVEAQPGGGELTLVLGVGAALQGVCLDAQSRRPIASEVTLSCAQLGTSATCVSTWGPSGFLLRGLLPGTYELFARSSSGLAGSAQGLRVERGRTLEGVVVVLSEGARLWLGYSGPAARARFELSRDGRPLLTTSLRSGERELQIVPAGVVSVRAFADERRVGARELRLAPGQEGEAVFLLD